MPNTYLDAVKNFAIVPVSTGYDDTDTSIDLSAGYGARLPFQEKAEMVPTVSWS
jgi:hypothetical protein